MCVRLQNRLGQVSLVVVGLIAVATVSSLLIFNFLRTLDQNNIFVNVKNVTAYSEALVNVARLKMSLANRVSGDDGCNSKGMRVIPHASLMR